MTDPILASIESLVRRVVSEELAKLPRTDDAVLTVAQAAEHMSVCGKTIKRWIASGQVRTLSDNPVRILRSELERVR